MTPPGGPTGPTGPTGPQPVITEREKRYSRNMHRQMIAQAREEANLYRRHYEVKAEHGSVDRELIADVAVHAFHYWDTLRASFTNAGMGDRFSELEEISKRNIRTDKHIADMDVDPSKFPEFIEELNTAVEETNILEMER